jgi:methylisocitrate lyase
MKAKKLRELLEKPEIIRAPGAYDAWSARMVEAAGFPAVYMTGAGVTASILGRADIGLLTMSEMVAQAKNIASAVNIPVIADADTGYGGVLNVIRTVEEYERAGVAAIHLEDQVMPKRCGHMDGKEVIEKAEMVSRIKAALSAKKDKDFVIIARTDARAVNGLEDAVDRAKAYAAAGADAIFFEAPASREEMRIMRENIEKPLLANMVEKGKTPFFTGAELQEMGYNIVIYPGSILLSATKAMTDVLACLKADDTTANHSADMIGFSDYFRLAGVEKERELEKSFI